jgi:hypothetical protein
MRDLLAGYKCVTYVCDKRFLLTLMFLDYAVEPFYFERGVDFYQDGQNYAAGSLLHVAGPTLLGRGVFDGMMTAFQLAVKEKSNTALGNLVAATRATNWQELPEILGPLAKYAAPECLSAIATAGVDTDAAMVVLQSLISRMEVMADGAYTVEHDQTKNLARYHDLIQRFIGHDDEIEFRASEIATLRFPLKLTEVTEVDSEKSPAVQLADVMIGAAIEAANTLAGQRTSGLDPEALLSMYADHQLIHLIPSIDFEEQRRFRQGSQGSELIDYLASNLFSPPKG